MSRRFFQIFVVNTKTQPSTFWAQVCLFEPTKTSFTSRQLLIQTQTETDRLTKKLVLVGQSGVTAELSFFNKEKFWIFLAESFSGNDTLKARTAAVEVWSRQRAACVSAEALFSPRLWNRNKLQKSENIQPVIQQIKWLWMISAVCVEPPQLHSAVRGQRMKQQLWPAGGSSVFLWDSESCWKCFLSSGTFWCENCLSLVLTNRS